MNYLCKWFKIYFMIINIIWFWARTTKRLILCRIGFREGFIGPISNYVHYLVVSFTIQIFYLIDGPFDPQPWIRPWFYDDVKYVQITEIRFISDYFVVILKVIFLGPWNVIKYYKQNFSSRIILKIFRLNIPRTRKSWVLFRNVF